MTRPDQPDHRHGNAKSPDDDLDEALDESFPASDPPSMTEPAAGRRPPPRRTTRKRPDRRERN
jgi:hypothetical protein